MTELKQVIVNKDLPSEWLLRDVLAKSHRGEISLSDVIVIWTDEDGVKHMRSVENEATER